ncbi:hypothetical protein [Nitrososphaera sp.]|uniref:hypothetical protein n=1 Tax=Nitrososphaera sp. TaxID=1971748 RepID=UPI00317ECBD5
MAYRRAAVVALVAGAALVASIFVMMPSLALINASEPSRRIMALGSNAYYPDTENEQVTMNAVRPGDMKPNSFVWFLDPYGKTMGELYDGSSASLTLDRKELERFEQRDAFEYYLLIRLPAWLGGEKDDTSSFRAYHAISLSDNCLFRYWSAEGRWRMENPCAGDIYRAWDGLAVAGPASVGMVGGTISTGYHPALQMLRLSVDSEGYLVAHKPDNSLQGDGVQAEGRRLSPQDVDESNKEMVQAAGEYAGYSLPFPSTIQTDYRLTDLNPSIGPWWMETQSEPPMQATYTYSNRQYAAITIDVYPVQNHPDLKLGGPLVSRSDSGYLVNGTVVGALLHVGYPRPQGMPEPQIREGTNIAGDFAILVAPSELGGDSYTGAGAIVWGKSPDGKEDIVVVLNTSDVRMDELASMVESLRVRKSG